MNKSLLVISILAVSNLAHADEPPTLRLGGGAMVLPARAQSMIGPAVSAGYNFNSNLSLDLLVSPLATMTRPVEFAFTASLGPTLRLFAPHSIVVGLRGVLVIVNGETAPGGILVLGYAYRGDTIHIEAVVGMGVLAWIQATCRPGGCKETYMTNPHRYPAVSVTVSWPVL